ncbi:MAG: GH92 family glycosyl hydrolase [Bacteroidales bacterium]
MKIDENTKRINLYFQFCILFIGFAMILSACKKHDDLAFTQYVNPMIGTGGHGHVFVGASVPHGMVQLGPNNMTKGWDWCSGYHDNDSTIIGFAHTHLSGTGIADLGDISFLPVNYSVNLADIDYSTTFSKTNEKVRPGYYSVLLDRSQIKVELTATQRVGFQRYVYPSGSEIKVIVDLLEAPKSLEAREGILESNITVLNDSMIAGYRYSNEWAKEHKVYFASKFSESFRNIRIEDSNIIQDTISVTGKNLKALIDFDSLGKNELLVKTGISYVSIDNALTNLNTEVAHWDFNQVRNSADHVWNEALSAIDFHSSDEDVMTMFYTALYHTKISPSLFSDVNGEYMGADGLVRKAEGYIPHSVFSLWDTYRAVHPLYTLIEKNNSDYVNSLLTIAEEQERLPIWHLVGYETDCMVGVHSIPVIVDAVMKQLPGIDSDRAYNLVRKFIESNDRGLDFVRNQEFIPADKEEWSVAKALEYAIDDYAIATLATTLNKQEDAKLFYQRSKYYRHYFDESIGFMRGKLTDGSWRKNFNPFHSIHLEDDYVEGNAWQYTWLVPHDVEGLIGLFGTEDAFLQKFDSLFLVSSELNEGASVDITGMIGQYAHGNEPSHHTLYLYPYAGKQWKTAEKVHQVYQQFYKNEPDGLIGNEDCGQMSAWYVFSSLGFYPVNPVDGIYVFGSPIVERCTLNLNNGKQFKIRVDNLSLNNKYIQSVKLNSKIYEKTYITHETIMNGGELVFTMTDQPCENFGLKKESRPYSKLNQTLELTN